MEFWMRILTWSLPAGRIMGIPLRVNWLLLLFIPALIGPFVRAAAVAGGGTAVWLLLVGTMQIMVLYGSVLLHELGHCWGNRLVGNVAREIQLTPLGGIAIGEGPNHSPRSELLVVGLGPAVSLALALAGWLASWMLQYLWPQAPWFVSFLFWSVFGTNAMLFLFNAFLPVFPLDSSKLVRAALSFRLNPRKATQYVAHAGIGLSVLILFSTFLGIRLPFLGMIGPMLMLILILGIQACVYELRAADYAPIYSTWDHWGGKQVYYDTEIMAEARRQARSDLRIKHSGPGLRPAAQTHERPAGKAGPQETKTRILLAVPKPEKLTDPGEVRRLMMEAAATQDFSLAAKLKRRLQELTDGK